MIKNRINKKKTNAYSIIRFTAFITFIVILIFIFYDSYKSNAIKKVFANNLAAINDTNSYCYSIKLKDSAIELIRKFEL